MNVLQLVDSLEMGGTEKMSVMIANELSERSGIQSHLYATHKSGGLEYFIAEKVIFKQGNKKHFADIKAFLGLKRYIVESQIQIIQAHSTSILWAVLLKILLPFKLKLVWHIHLGFLEKRKPYVTQLHKLASQFVDFAIVVNKKLYLDAIETMHIEEKKVKYLPNFSELDLSDIGTYNWNAPGKIKIVMIANLRPQKDYENLLNIIKILKKETESFHVLCIGVDANDEYSKQIKNTIQMEELSPWITLMGRRNDIAAIAGGADIAILTSRSEGLPLSIIEYGLLKLPVVCTNVGECAEILQHGAAGVLVPAANPQLFANAIFELYKDETKMKAFSLRLFENVQGNFGKQKFTHQLLEIYDGLDVNKMLRLKNE